MSQKSMNTTVKVTRSIATYFLHTISVLLFVYNHSMSRINKIVCYVAIYNGTLSNLCAVFTYNLSFVVIFVNTPADYFVFKNSKIQIYLLFIHLRQIQKV